MRDAKSLAYSTQGELEDIKSKNLHEEIIKIQHLRYNSIFVKKRMASITKVEYNHIGLTIQVTSESGA